jgi:mono/diheme cytochrome c family protein
VSHPTRRTTIRWRVWSNTLFGVIYGTNITPDPKSGVGTWSIEAFTRAMREGVARDGSHLFPAFPYYAYTKLSDDDVEALYAHLMTRPAATALVPANTLPFPFKIRALQEGWKIPFFKGGRFQANPSESAEWNRGAYLAEALSDCTACHIPRNSLGPERTGYAYSGAVIDGWIAPALNETNPSTVPWTQEELFTYLRRGVTAVHGTTGATMTPVIREGLAPPAVPDSDVRAIAVYFSDMDHAGSRARRLEVATREALANSSLGSGQEYDPDPELYASACMACHYNSGTAPLPARPELALNSAVGLPEPTNFLQVVLNGVSNTEGVPGLLVPAYASSLAGGGLPPTFVQRPQNIHRGATWKRRFPPSAGSRRDRSDES